VAHGADLVLLPPLLLLTTRAVSAQLVLRWGTGGRSHSQHTYVHTMDIQYVYPIHTLHSVTGYWRHL